MKKSFIFLTILAISFFASGQKLDMKNLKGFKPRAIGPAGMSGRVTTVDVEIKDVDHILIGTASGGVWESFSGGTNWKPVFDDAPVQSIGAVAIDQSNPDVMWVGTGEANLRNSTQHGDGIYKSDNGGTTWVHLGLNKTHHIGRVIIHPKNPETKYMWLVWDQLGVQIQIEEYLNLWTIGLILTMLLCLML